MQRIKIKKETSFFHVWWLPFTNLKVSHLNIQIKFESTCLFGAEYIRLIIASYSMAALKDSNSFKTAQTHDYSTATRFSFN